MIRKRSITTTRAWSSGAGARCAGRRQGAEGFGREPAKYRYDVIFLKAPLTSTTAFKEVEMKEASIDGTGRAHVPTSRLISEVTSSRINRIVGRPVYQRMTIRNWNTTTSCASSSTSRSSAGDRRRVAVRA